MFRKPAPSHIVFDLEYFPTITIQMAYTGKARLLSFPSLIIEKLYSIFIPLRNVFYLGNKIIRGDIAIRIQIRFIIFVGKTKPVIRSHCIKSIYQLRTDPYRAKREY